MVNPALIGALGFAGGAALGYVIAITTKTTPTITLSKKDINTNEYYDATFSGFPPNAYIRGVIWGTPPTTFLVGNADATGTLKATNVQAPSQPGYWPLIAYTDAPDNTVAEIAMNFLRVAVPAN